MTSGRERREHHEKRRAREGDELMNPQAIDLWRTLRNRECEECNLHKWARNRCLLGDGPVPAAGMIICDGPLPEDEEEGRVYSDSASSYLYHTLEGLDLDPMSVYRTYVTKCVGPEPGAPQRADQILKGSKVCAPLYLAREIEMVRPRAILALGAAPYFYFKHKAGITKNRGQAFEWTLPDTDFTTWVVPSLHPRSVMKEPRYLPSFQADVVKWVRLLGGVSESPKVHIVEVRTLDDLRAMDAELREEPDALLTFDVETRGFKDSRPDYSRMWSMALTRGRRDDQGMRVFAVPLEHPETPLRQEAPTPDWAWRAVLRAPYRDGLLRRSQDVRETVETVCRLVLEAKHVNGHNVKYDLKNTIRLASRYGIEPWASRWPL